MRFFFVTYCFGSFEGQTLIGVYKRGLRVAMQLCDRGHEVVFFCTGRDAYHDELTEAAQQRMRFVDIPFSVAAFAEADENRGRFLEEMGQIEPDVVVVGEAPLAGTMLECALCAVELGIPLAILDNAYNPLFVDVFGRELGPLADAVILTGPSSHHTPEPPPFLYQAPPFIESRPEEARRLLAELGLSGERLVMVLAYDRKVQQVGLALLEALDGPELEMLFCARDPAECQAALEGLPAAARTRARVIGQPADSILFGLLEVSRLAVVKYGFMQVSECLALGTPAVVVYHEGPTWLDALPEAGRPFAWRVDEVTVSAETAAAARRLLALGPEEMAAAHNGEFDGPARAAGFLERVPREPRAGPAQEAARLGFSQERLETALGQGNGAVAVEDARVARLRVTADYDLYVVLCRTRRDGRPGFERLWGRVYRSDDAAHEDLRSLLEEGGPRRPLVYFGEARLLLEENLGEAELPPLNP